MPVCTTSVYDPEDHSSHGEAYNPGYSLVQEKTLSLFCETLYEVFG